MYAIFRCMSDTSSSREGIKSILSTIVILVTAPLIALLITGFVFQSYEVDGESMETTLQHKDRLIVLKLPRSWARLTKKDYIPAREDVVIFNRGGTIETGTNRERQLIKRVIALPGERVVVEEGKLTVFNKENPNGYSPDSSDTYGKAIGYTSGKVDLTVPEGEVFVCGDNRGNSQDSRSFGTVPAQDIVGKLALRILPFNHARTF